MDGPNEWSWAFTILHHPTCGLARSEQRRTNTQRTRVQMPFWSSRRVLKKQQQSYARAPEKPLHTALDLLPPGQRSTARYNASEQRC